jgi:hypothetical protein
MGSLGWVEKPLIYLLLRQQLGANSLLLVEEHDETVLTVNLHYGCRHQPLSLTFFQQNISCNLIEAGEWEDGAVLGCVAEFGLLN